jgi:hypothetical protein
MEQSESPWQLVVAGGELFWSTALGKVVHMPIAGGSRTIVPGVQLTELGVFAVTPDAILYDFSGKGYHSTPR